MSNMPTVLETIVARKHEEVREGQAALSIEKLKYQIARRDEYRGFAHALLEKVKGREPAVIAEIKKASPSKGVLRDPFEPAHIAHSYALGGATCLSVLTDKDFFQGDEQFLRDARNCCTLPVLRKDFIVDPWQVYQTAAMGADCMLLIVSCLDDVQLQTLYTLGRDLGLDVLVEVHDQDEMARALKLDQHALLGVNNRNLHTFEVSLQTTMDVLEMVPEGRPLITESGILVPEDMAGMMKNDIFGFLIGEAFMRQDDPGHGLATMMRDAGAI